MVGELVTIEADLVADGHDKLAGEVRIRPADAEEFTGLSIDADRQ